MAEQILQRGLLYWQKGSRIEAQGLCAGNRKVARQYDQNKRLDVRQQVNQGYDGKTTRGEKITLNSCYKRVYREGDTREKKRLKARG